MNQRTKALRSMQRLPGPPKPVSMLPLTDRQQAVLAAIVSLMASQKRSPTIRELGAKLGIASPNGVQAHLRALAKKGFIKSDRTSRSIQLLKQRVCPCCGTEITS